MPGTEHGVTRERLLSMMTAYKSTYLLRAAIELGVFDALADGSADPDTVAAILRTSPRGTRLLLRALAAAGLLAVDGEQFGLAPGAETLLVRSSPQYGGGVVRVAASDWEWDAMKDLAGAVRAGGTLLAENAEAPGFPYWVDFATHLTFATGPGAEFVADLLVPAAAGRDRYGVLDVGCGHGLFGFAVAQRVPGATVSCLDWPDVLDVARGHAERLGLADRVHYLPGDAFEVPLGGPYDAVVLGNFLFQFSARRGTELLRRLAGALKPGGRVVVIGFTTGDRPPAEDYHAHLLSLLMLAGTTEGELHSPIVYQKMLATAGFAATAAHERPGLPLRAVTAELA
ncbi:Methyltransferase type 12 [Actinokineospora spheciospongiae]|uniref:Methyltransferase type 12 n=1 Tax=Actinokineospora spheciospongiae TaxID=909613 RepID=W7J2M5_9PSEU|nr:class I SAM-dependent methyltransferase [Actinokineospora spheciospongiae]EWC63317.1 Methyltransferase type 12 [Actinokineospora spheciospongiae]